MPATCCNGPQIQVALTNQVTLSLSPHSQVVLVGDPKQLPATLFARNARDVLLERSLFERMAQVIARSVCGRCACACERVLKHSLVKRMAPVVACCVGVCSACAYASVCCWSNPCIRVLSTWRR